MNQTITPLAWLERVLLAAGFALALWSLLAAAQMHFYRSLPVPGLSSSAPARVAVLPGDSGDATTARMPAPGASAPKAGAWIAKLEAPSVGLVATVIEGS